MIYIINKVLGTARKGGAISSFLIFISHLLFVSCANDDEVVINTDSVNVEMAYAFPSEGYGGMTRQASAVITDATNPRLPQSFRIIPLINGAPGSIDLRWQESVSKDDPKSQFYRYRYCNLPIETNGILVYGDVLDLTPPNGVDSKMYNGSLVQQFPFPIVNTNDVQEGISFSLEPIYKALDYSATNGIPAGAAALANSMTAITQATGWQSSANSFLVGLLEKFTNKGKDLPGSTASVKVWIEEFKKIVEPKLTDPELSEVHGILTAIFDAVNAQLAAIGEPDDNSYPRNMNLPDGAAVLRWADVTENDVTVKKFVPQINTTTLDNINSMGRFAYPAPLYYFINTDIKAAEEKVDFATVFSNVESDATKTAWTKVLENDKFTRTIVTANTKAVALTRPVQYAVGQLNVNIKAFSTQLPDAENTLIDVTGNRFQLTGIIVCDQRIVDYKFVPKEVQQGTVSDADVLFIYDSQVESNCYLNPTNAEDVWIPGCKTLVLQSYKDEDVNIVLEFENKGNQAFTCVDGTVYPGTRFYMVGKVDASLYNSNDPNVKLENRNQVFTKDYITTVNMTVSSLARAYNVPPNLLSNNLEIGVETTPQWEGATPTVIRLE